MPKRGGKSKTKSKHAQVDSVVAEQLSDAVIAKLAELGLNSAPNLQPDTDPEATSSSSTDQQKQPDSIVPPSESYAKTVRSAILRSLAPTAIPAAIDIEADTSSSAKQQKQRRKDVPKSRSDPQLPPWPSEEFGAPLTFKVFRAGLRELQTCSRNHVRASTWMSPGAKFWLHLLSSLYAQAETAASEEKTLMSDELRTIPVALRGAQVPGLEWPLNPNGASWTRSRFLRVEQEKKSPAGDFLDLLQSQSADDVTTHSAEFEAMSRRLQYQVSRVWERFSELFEGRHYAVFTIRELMRSFGHIEQMMTVLRGKIETLHDRSLDALPARQASAGPANKHMSRDSQTKSTTKGKGKEPVRDLRDSDSNMDEPLFTKRHVDKVAKYFGANTDEGRARFRKLFTDVQRYGVPCPESGISSKPEESLEDID
ncbi:Nn.00g036810.m01.CDS01 [Neocucurbitaria sp. VM-36]